MAENLQRGNDRWQWPMIGTELLLLNLILAGVWTMLGLYDLDKVLIAWNVSYIVAIAFCPPITFRRSVRPEQIATSVLKMSLWLIFIFYFLLLKLQILKMRFVYYIIFAIAIFLLLLTVRLLWSRMVKMWRFSGNDNARVVLVGDGDNMLSLYNDMTDDTSMGYRVVGYFADKPSEIYPTEVERIGAIDDVLRWLETNGADFLFCNLPAQCYNEVQGIINYCENHLIHFFAVPNVISYMHHRMRVQFIGNSIVLSLRNEPLNRFSAQLLKRIFDIVFSLLICVLLLWWLIPLVALITTLTMPGPIFFRQRRNGVNNKEFTCLKFRTMVMNKEADSKQATRNDERITCWGRFMRKTSLDELPQFLNVLVGDMSVVGPRPHMIKHNDEYSKLIDKYTVRSYLRPGITGWAQVSGNRGETKTLGEMEQRIVKDIWYIENWSFMLDMLIIFRTIVNLLGGERGNAY